MAFVAPNSGEDIPHAFHTASFREEVKPVLNINPNIALKATQAFKEFLIPLQDSTVREIENEDIISWDYSDIVPRGRSENGAQLWEAVRIFGDSEGYKNPRFEKDLVVQCRPDFARLARHHMNMTSIGPGTHDAVVTNEYAIAWELDTEAFNAFDINKALAQGAASSIKNRMKTNGRRITSRSYQGDFMQEWPAALRSHIPMFGTMLGGTLSQYDAHEFFNHFNNMTNYSSILFFTADCNRVNPLDSYQGPAFRKFKENLWHMLQTAANDFNFDPSKISYFPDWDGERIVHRYVVKSDTRLKLGGEEIPFRQGTFITTGYSRRPLPESFAEASIGTGAKIISAGRSHEGHVHGFYLVGDGFRYTDALRNG